MYCTQCGTQNLSDSKFCRECGVKIPPPLEAEPLRLSVFQEISQRAEAEDEPADPKLQHLLDMALWHKNAGNARGAILACEAALILNPDSATALSILGCLYEQAGRNEDAIVMFERIVTLNPASTADLEKLASLRKGVTLSAVEQPALYRWTPPALIQAVRERRITPGIGAGLAVLAVLLLGGVAIHAMMGPRTAIASAAPIREPGSASPPAAARPAPAALVQALPPSTPAVTAMPNPFAQAALLEGIAREQPPVRAIPSRARPTRVSAFPALPHLPDVDSVPTSVPSVVDVRPIRAASSAVPTHIVPVALGQTEPQHTIVVGGGQADSAPASTVDDPEQPAPPQSQIEISVQDHSSAADAPANHGRPAITLREDPGAALQQKALSYQQQSDYARASAAYQTAIGAYKQDLAAGRNTDEARRGIAACETGLQICKQSQ